MSMGFAKATRRKARLRITLTSPSGGGKTLGALMIAKGMGGRIGVIDTERGSASLYASVVTLADGSKWTPPEFDVLELLPPYTPERYIEAITLAEAAGFDIVIIDSTTHEWSGQGGCLEINDTVSKQARHKGNKWSAWSEVTPRHQAFVDKMLGSPCHLITTMRSKTETAQQDRGDRKVVVKLGMKSEQRDGMEFEFGTVLDIQHEGHLAVASKDRTGVFAGDARPITEETGRLLLEFLNTGEDIPPPPPPVTDDDIRDWTDEITKTRSEPDLDRVKAACHEKCRPTQDTAAAARVNEVCRAHRQWLRATQNGSATTSK